MLETTIKKVLVTEEEICVKSQELGQLLTMEYADKNPLMVAILKGSIPFFAELTKRMGTHIEMDFMVVSSYHGGTQSSGEVKMIKDLDTAVEGRNVIIVEDIIDTGRTLLYLKELLLHRKAKSVKIVTLVDKPEGRVVEIDADYVGFTLPNEFLVGFGLDYDEHYRNLPYIGVLKEEVYQTNV
ncbi:hypoxanthine-guanine phosphoribosyltransferase [Lactococcus hodotermopsidis]|uniref:Hypoxanthine phosphoribosyltransferase n=1 Tax=Pseudolactococcus hodotermopsidis TaxID=2709157 RepID=A0A6A0BDS0_9LACT|nr:hypoxanthine phosphoribosyltransferase [Lactococcus hodotermopsidis]GFH42634.1 hypoxanthine-guanine phosphoribosyltransferase [Lactococcus hodotermopsidis]